MCKKEKCPYCGNNPIPHYLNWYFDSINILFEKIQVGIFTNPLIKFLNRFEDDITLFLIGLGRLLRIVHLGKSPSKYTLSRAKVLWEEAEKRGLEMREVKLFDRNIDTYLVRKKIPGKRWKKLIVFSGLPRPKSVKQENLAVLDDKSVFKKLCQKNDLPVADGGVAGTFEEAKKIFDRIQKPVIVKPRLGSRGRHVVTYIYTHDDLREAFRIARQLCLWVIVEEQFFGPVYRGTVINYKIEGVNGATQPEIFGDGEKDIATLIQEKNDHRPKGVTEFLVNQKATWFITRQLAGDGRRPRPDVAHPWKVTSGKDWDKSVLQYIPKKGEHIYLTEKVAVGYGALMDDEQFDECHPDTKALFEKAAQVCGDTILGFDFIIPDITRSWKEQRCGFLEVNTVPFINIHHEPFHGEPRNIAAKVWDMIEF